MTVTAETDGEGALPREGIFIVGDMGFTRDNGVTAGSGTPFDPYIISVGRITTMSGPAIWIQCTSRHFIIRDTQISGMGKGSVTTGIYLDAAAHPRIENVTLTNLTRGISTLHSGPTHIKEVEVITCQVGLELIDSDMALVTDSDLKECGIGISLIDSDRADLTRVDIGKCTEVGLRFHGCDLFDIDQVTILANDVGIEVVDSDDGRIGSCTAKDNAFVDILLYQADGLVMRKCRLGPRGLVLSNTEQASIDMSNHVNGAPLRYLRNRIGVTIDGSAGQVILEDCDRVTVRDLDLKDVAYPLTVTHCRDCSLVNITARNAFTSLYVREGCCLNVESCSFHSMGHPDVDPAAIMMVNHSGSTVKDTRIEGIEGVGISIIGGDELHLDNITATGLSCTAICIGGCYPVSEGSAGPSVIIEGSRFCHNGWAGVVTRSGSLVVNGTSFTGNGGPGILCSGIGSATIARSTFRDNGWGIIVKECGEVLITDVQVDRASTGVEVIGTNFSIETARLSNLTSGIVITGCEAGTIEDCLVRDTGTTGVLVHSSREVRICHSHVVGPVTGILLSDTIGCSVDTTSIEGAVTGLDLERTWNCSVKACTISGCQGWGILTQNGGNYTFYHNNLVDNQLAGAASTQARDASGTGAWDDGTEGNFWSDYLDQNSNAIRSGRVFDLPYMLDGGSGSEDQHPLGLLVDLAQPVAVAGADIEVEQDVDLVLDGTDSWDNIGIVEYLWKAQAVGGTVTLEGPTPRFCTACPGTFEVVLTVSDEWGNHDSDLVVVKVLDTRPPRVDLPATIVVDVGEPFLLGGCVICDPSGIGECVWTIDGDGDHLDLEGTTPRAILDRTGSYSLSLSVTDRVGNVGTFTSTLIVVDRRPPVADAGDDILVDQGQEIHLDASSSVDNVGISEYRWSLFGHCEHPVMTGARPSLMIDEPGTYLVLLKVEDASGNVGIDRTTITVIDRQGPIAEAGNDAFVPPGTKVMLTAAGSRDNDGITWCTWSIDLGDATISLWGSEVQWTFDTPGTFPVTLTVRDAAGNKAFDGSTVHVTDPEQLDTPDAPPVRDMRSTTPVANAGEDVVIHAGDRLYLDAGGDVTSYLTYRWVYRNMAAHHVLEGPSNQVTFDVPGTYTIWLSVSDEEGNTAVDRMEVTVLPDVASTIADGEQPSWLVSWGWLLIEVLLVLVLIGLFWYLTRPRGQDHPF